MRVVVTGLGVVSPLGVGVDDTARAILAGRTGIAPLTLFALPGARVSTAGQVTSLPPGPGSRADRMAVTAAREALGDLPSAARRATALFVGGTMGGIAEAESSLAALTLDPARTDHDVEAMRGHALSAPADRVHQAVGPFASTRTVCSACSGGALAIALAAAAIRAGHTERALAGGVDALGPMILAGFAALSALDPGPCRPFDVSRAGLSLGEGAAFLLLEREDVARARGATAIVEIAGWASAAEAHHVTQPAPDGEVVGATLARAMARAGMSRDDVDWVNAHGTGTPANDAMEAAAIASVLGRVAVSSLKGNIGHALAAAGAIEAAIGAWCMQNGVLPPTAGLVTVDPACAGVDHVREARQGPVRGALSSSFGFGGTDVVLALRTIEAAPPVGAAPGAPGVIGGIVVTASCTLGPRGLGVDPRVYLDPRSPPADGVADVHASSDDDGVPPDVPLAVPPDALDPMRTRRFDRASRLATLVAEVVLRDGPSPARTGIVVGSAFGSVEATGAFLRQIATRGVRFASPAAFPTVLPSGVASNPSIYLGLRGPALACSDLGVSAEAALGLGALLLEDDQVDAVIVAAVEEHSAVASAVSTPLHSHLEGRGRGEGAAAMLLETAAGAAARGARPLAGLAASWSWRGERPALPPPTGAKPMMVVARAGLAAVAGWPPPRSVRRAGTHESVGGLALAAAVVLLAAGEADEVLVVGDAPDRGHAFRFTLPLSLSPAPHGASRT